MKQRNAQPNKRGLAGALWHGAALAAMVGGVAMGVWGRSGPAKRSRKLPSRGDSPGVNPDQRLVEPLGPGVAWGQLEDLTGKYSVRPIMLTRAIIILGRQSDCDVILEDERASRYHVILTWDHDKGYARDNNSTNGTSINGQACQGPVLLRHGDIIEAAGAEFRFTYTEASGLAVLDAQPTEKFSLPGVRPPEARPAVKARLTAHTGPEPGRSWPIITGVVSIGRAGDNVVVLPHPSVSRHHAQIVVQPTGLYVMDANSSNGVSVNGEALVAPRLLRDGDHIQIGDILLVIKMESGAALSGDPEDLPTQQLPATSPALARVNPAVPPYHGARTRPGPWRSSSPSAPSQPDAPPIPPGQFRPPTIPIAPQEGERHLPRFQPHPPRPDDEPE